MPTDTVSPAPSSEPAQRLADASLPGTQAELPAYDRSGLSTGIVHIGVGGFHRAHQAVVMDDLLAQGGHGSWAITGLGALAENAAVGEVEALAGGREQIRDGAERPVELFCQCVHRRSNRRLSVARPPPPEPGVAETGGIV